MMAMLVATNRKTRFSTAALLLRKEDAGTPALQRIRQASGPCTVKRCRGVVVSRRRVRRGRRGRSLASSPGRRTPSRRRAGPRGRSSPRGRPPGGAPSGPGGDRPPSAPASAAASRRPGGGQRRSDRWARAGWPSVITKGRQSWTTLALPPIIARRPTRQNWWTPTPPPRNARSPTSTWPASMTLLAMIDAVADAVVVGDVDVGHQEAVGADDGGPAGLRRAVDRHALPDDVAVPDHDPGFLLPEREVLRLAAQDRPLVDAIAAAHRDVSLDDGVGRGSRSRRRSPCRLDDGAGADRHVAGRCGRPGRRSRWGARSWRAFYVGAPAGPRRRVCPGAPLARPLA